MNDFFERYKKKRILNHLAVFGLAFTFALGVHMTLFSGNTGQYITASVLDIGQQEQEVQKADIYAELKDGILIIRNSQDITSLEDISFTIAYNPELGILSTEELGGLEVEAQTQENEAGLIFIQLMLLDEAQDLPAGSRIARLPYQDKAEGRQFFNIIQASFTDSNGEIFLLTSSGIEL
ncbi:hypothetical protein LAT59_03030 [Candidatus Gracilibacteria bacterium]|nr:hypothetical protein [Candidatus Gracilibacteria bacterium]